MLPARGPTIPAWATRHTRRAARGQRIASSSSALDPAAQQHALHDILASGIGMGRIDASPPPRARFHQRTLSATPADTQCRDTLVEEARDAMDVYACR
jgi:hypothetical protein